MRLNVLLQAWYHNASWLWLLWPLSLMFRGLSFCRRQVLAVVGRPGEIPVVVVGNITLGGTGKTPLLMALCAHWQEQGRQPGIISRGYGGRGATYPLTVTADSSVDQAGDEAVLIATRTGCPMVVDPDRARALRSLLARHEVDIVLSDDGLQHYRLPRHIEIAVVDGSRRFGNGLCLPAGPLREPVSRLREVDLVVVNGAQSAACPALADACAMRVEALALVNLCSGEKRPLAGAPFPDGSVIRAVAAIGNPRRFFEALHILPYPLQCRTFPDHYRFQARDFADWSPAQDRPIVMTEKDAVKCREFAIPDMWYLETAVELSPDLLPALDRRLSALSKSASRSYL